MLVNVRLISTQGASENHSRFPPDHERFDACRDNAIASASSQMNAVIASARSPDHRYAMKDDAIAMLGR